MNQNLKRRIIKLEQLMTPPKREAILVTFHDQCGKDGEAIPRETDEEAMAHHLAAYPNDKNAEFTFLQVVFVGPKSVDSEGNNVW